MAITTLDGYIASGQGRDKAGGYGIQDEGFAPVASIEGCYCNVMGLPLWTTCHLLARVDASPPISPRSRHRPVPGIASLVSPVTPMRPLPRVDRSWQVRVASISSN